MSTTDDQRLRVLKNYDEVVANQDEHESLSYWSNYYFERLADAPLSAHDAFRAAWFCRAALAQQASTPAAVSEPAAPVDARNALTAKQRFDVLWEFEDGHDPVKRLRFFCSLAMNGQDWCDVESFFDAIARQAATPAEGEKS